MMDDDIVVRYIDLPCSIKGVTQYDENGTANIYINAKLNDEQQRIGLSHELRHVRRNDFYNSYSIRRIERN